MYALKDYQQKALAALEGFFRKLRGSNLDAAWEACAPLAESSDGSLQRQAYSSDALGDVPAVCVRIPTGGGKTFLAAHAVAQVGKALQDTEAPVALWLVPSDAIRAQRPWRRTSASACAFARWTSWPRSGHRKWGARPSSWWRPFSPST